MTIEATRRAGLVIRGLEKRYGETLALDGLDLDAARGEILGIAGPNGAGKSTLVKILAGETVADGGVVQFDGAPWTSARSSDDVAVVHQEPQVFPNLTVLDNLIVGRERSRARRPHADARDRSLLADLSIDGFADTLLSNCSLAVRQRTEIARALAHDASLFLFDEPNSALTAEESAQLFVHMSALAAAGCVVILVSHRLADLVAQTARVVVILDGRQAHTLTGSELSQDSLARLLAVRTSAPVGTTRSAEIAPSIDVAETVLEIDAWQDTDGLHRPVDFRVESGEIVAVMGVEGSGGRQFSRSLAALEQRADGSRGRRAGFVPGDRSVSVYPNKSVAENLVARLGRQIVSRIGLIDRRKVNAVAGDAITRFDIRCRSGDQPIGSLSGGNQQKVVVAGAMLERLSLLVLEEPTRGVDIASKSEIYWMLRDYAKHGGAVVIFATEVPEVYGVADRLYVMSNNELFPSMSVASFADEKSLAAAVTDEELFRRRAQPPALPA